MIIVEGPDGAGKTTLIQQIVDKHGLEIAPRVVSKDTEAMVDLRAWVEEDVVKPPQLTIYDRYRLLSEPVYGPILRSEIQPGFQNLYWFAPAFMGLIRNRQPLIIYCLPPLSIVKANVENDPDNQVVANKIEAIYSAYVAQASMVHVLYGRTLIWDYDSPMGDINPVIDSYVNWVRGGA